METRPLRFAASMILVFILPTLFSCTSTKETDKTPAAVRVPPDLAGTWPFENLETNLPPYIAGNKLEKNPLLKLGFLDITLYGADPTGSTDSTKAIQQAMDDAYFYDYVCFFPAGTYLVSDTLTGMQRLWRYSYNRHWMSSRRKAHTLVGEKMKRPILKLANNAAGFDDPAHLKPVIQMWAQPQVASDQEPPSDIAHEQGNINFNQKIIGLDFDLTGSRHSGAVAIRFCGAQGTTIEDVTINAAGAFAGIYNLPGTGGGVYNIEIISGRHAIYIENKGYCTIAGAVFRDQTDLCIYDTHLFPLTLVGFSVVKENGPAFAPNPKNKRWIQGGLSLVDGTIELKNPGTAILNENQNMLVIRNVYCRNADILIKNRAGNVPGSGNGGSWDRIAEYSGCWNGAKTSYNVIDGAINQAEIISSERGCPKPSVDFIARHVWQESVFPSFADSDAVNVKTLGARGDGIHDDTNALQAAIDTHDKVFLPRGVYLIRDTLHLQRDTRLFGAGPTITIIRPDINVWKPTAEIPLIDTANDAKATVILANLNLLTPVGTGDHFYFNNLRWKAGRNSIVRNVTFTLSGWLEKPIGRDLRLISITENGGGRWYGIYTDDWARHTDHPDFRQLLVSGTSEPLSFYSLNIERSKSQPQAEIRNAGNVQIFFLKSEHNQTPLFINQSRNIFILGYGGNASPQAGLALFEINNSDDIYIANACPTNRDPKTVPYGGYSSQDPGSGMNIDPSLASVIHEDYDGQSTTLSKLYNLSVFTRGRADLHSFYP